MSDTDSFIDEVTEEVRRDKFYQTLRRYGWIAVLAIILLVGGAAFNEWRKAQARSEAQALGDSVLAALNEEDRAARAAALAEIEAPEGGARAIVGLLAAGEGSGVDAPEAATQLLALADDPTVPQIYRQIAVLKAVALPDSGLSAEDRMTRLEGLTPGGGIVRLLAEEQMALIDLETGDADAALTRLRDVIESAEATPGLRQRVAQLIVALGGDPDGPPEAAETSGENDGN